MENISIIIPSLDPNQRLIALLYKLREKTGAPIILVNDGSSAEYDAIFKRAQVLNNLHYLKFTENQGKGAALKAAFQYQLINFPTSIGVVTADSDGQHAPDDIIKLMKEMTLEKKLGKASLLLGARDFSKPDVPFKSYWGNRITSVAFRIISGQKCQDTQTGLRAIPQKYLTDLKELKGNRFEYEMNMLIEAKDLGIPLKSVPIETIYLEQNQHSHFRPFQDAVLIYQPFLKFVTASLTSALLDFMVFSGLYQVLELSVAEKILYATVIARCLSGGFNFLVNRYWVFESRGDLRSEGTQYTVLFFLQMFSSYALVLMLSMLVSSIFIVKIVVDGMLFLVSYLIQQRFIFRKKRQKVG